MTKSFVSVIPSKLTLENDKKNPNEFYRVGHLLKRTTYSHDTSFHSFWNLFIHLEMIWKAAMKWKCFPKNKNIIIKYRDLLSYATNRKQVNTQPSSQR